MKHQELQEKLDRHLSLLEQDETNLMLLLEISNLYLELDDMELAQSYMNRASSVDREACLGHQGLLYLNEGKLSEAKDCFLEALNYSNSPALRYNLGFIYFINYDFDKAWEVLAPLHEDEHHPEAELLMARILHRQDSLDEAINLVHSILEHNPDDAEALGFLSLLYFDLNDEVSAKETSERTLELNPDNYDAQLIHIMVRLATQETTVEEIEGLLQINPEDSRLWFALGSTCMAEGDFVNAQLALQKAIEIYPEFYDCYIALAWCQLISDQISEAQQTYQHATELFEEFADGWGGLALIHALNQNLLKAEQLIDKANNLFADCFLTELAQTICLTYKNPDQAKTHLAQSLKNQALPVSKKVAVLIEEF